MIEIKIPKEIKDYKEKFLFGLTVRQFVCLALALAIGVPLYIFGKNIMPEDIVSWVVIIVVAPILGIGFIKYHNMTFIQFMQKLFYSYFKPQKRKYMELPVFWYAREAIINDMLLKEYEQRKEYLAEKKRKGFDYKRYKKYIVLTEKRKDVKKSEH